MNSYPAFDNFEFDNESEQLGEEDIELEVTQLKANLKAPEKEEEEDKPKFVTPSLKPYVRKTILTADDFIPSMAKLKSEKEVKKPALGNGKTNKGDKSEEKKQVHAKNSGKGKANRESTNNKGGIGKRQTNVSKKEKGSKKESTPKTLKAPPKVGKSLVDKVVPAKARLAGKNKQISQNLERQLKNTFAALYQHFFKLN